MWVIYTHNASNEVLYVGEDDIVYGTNNLYTVVNKAVVFKTKEEAETYCNYRYSSLEALNCNLFIAELTVNTVEAPLHGAEQTETIYCLDYTLDKGVKEFKALIEILKKD